MNKFLQKFQKQVGHFSDSVVKNDNLLITRNNSLLAISVTNIVCTTVLKRFKKKKVFLESSEAVCMCWDIFFKAIKPKALFFVLSRQSCQLVYTLAHQTSES